MSTWTVVSVGSGVLHLLRRTGVTRVRCVKTNQYYLLYKDRIITLMPEVLTEPRVIIEYKYLLAKDFMQ